ncbi:nuclease-related domain-containing protein [Priestia abyssalis]|uniref:nuclease-related domain-containing protein n=1 Tax=Priestia abyssalis TaxID=1221450 RepID=UPI000995250E|nr:nuclease-related domain-containing protein [Priestia abyssalis]
MIIKPRKIPLSILKLRALLRRLPSNHPKIPLIQQELSKREAGYKGESSLDFYLSFLDEKNYFIFHDLRLQDESRFFQIDTLLLSKKFALIIEVKNIAGTLFFDHVFHQLIRMKDGMETAFPDPLIQIQRQESQLKNWFTKHKLLEIPIYSLIVISNAQAVIRTSSDNRKLGCKVIRREMLPSKVNQIEHSLKETLLSEKELKKMLRQLQKQHVEADFPILEQYAIGKNELIKGVICENCRYFPLLRRHGKWICPHCQHVSKDWHLHALTDYSLLIGSAITNAQLRNFLNITSSAGATRILQSMSLSYSGTNKGRVYNLFFDRK